MVMTESWVYQRKMARMFPHLHVVDLEAIEVFEREDVIESRWEILGLREYRLPFKECSMEMPWAEGDKLVVRAKEAKDHYIMSGVLLIKNGGNHALPIYKVRVKDYDDRCLQAEAIAGDYHMIYDDETSDLIAKCVVQACAFMVSLTGTAFIRKEIVFPDEINKKKKPGQARLPEWTRVCLTKTYAKSENELKGTVRPHWRCGHYRNQPCGPGKMYRKLVYIDPILVNPLSGVVPVDKRKVVR
jgi:hypothetical protein